MINEKKVFLIIINFIIVRGWKHDKFDDHIPDKRKIRGSPKYDSK
jgi:hypothetical protein